MDYGQVSMFESVPTISYSFIRDWRDQSSTTLYEAQKGLATRDRLQRQVLFGPNLVDIKGKSVLSLLVEEVRKFPECTSKQTHLLLRLSIHFMSSKSPASFFGPSTIIIITHFVLLSFLHSAY
jgi:hypothetical protein